MKPPATSRNSNMALIDYARSLLDDCAIESESTFNIVRTNGDQFMSM